MPLTQQKGHMDRETTQADNVKQWRRGLDQAAVPVKLVTPWDSAHSPQSAFLLRKDKNVQCHLSSTGIVPQRQGWGKLIWPWMKSWSLQPNSGGAHKLAGYFAVGGVLVNYALSFPATLLEGGGCGWNSKEGTYINPATVEWIDSSGRVRSAVEVVTNKGFFFSREKRQPIPKYFMSIWSFNNTE